MASAKARLPVAGRKNPGGEIFAKVYGRIGTLESKVEIILRRRTSQ